MYAGLKRVISTPNDISPRTTFISGTKEHVKFYYSSTCCSTTAKITAIDVSNNQYTRTLDVTGKEFLYSQLFDHNYLTKIYNQYTNTIKTS